MVKIPRVVIAAPASSQGKTTITIGLMAALRQAGHAVAPFKIGPDYIDPGYHGLAAGRVGRNLDAHLCGTDLMVPLLEHGAHGADIAVIEGVMGLFDGKLGTNGFGSTAHLAELLSAPVILVLDGSGSSVTPAAVALGLATYSDRINLAGVILNKVSSPRAAAEMREAFKKTGIELLGVIPRSSDLVTPSRHLGLIPAAERDSAQQMVDRAGQIVAENVDLAALVEIAQQAPELPDQPWKPEVQRVSGSPNIVVAGGSAFTFYYPETTELLEAAGCRVSSFDPINDTELPSDTAGLYLGGGFPEVYARELASNRGLLDQIRQAVQDGLPTVAECAGLLYLAKSLDGVAMSGALDLNAMMSPRLTMGYKVYEPEADSVIYRVGEPVTYHEFHRTKTDQTPMVSTDTIQASYQHLHWAAYPQFASRFAQAAANSQVQLADTGSRFNYRIGDLYYHGDLAASGSELDFAVNIRSPEPDPELQAALAEDIVNWAAYPNTDQARQAIADRHQVAPEMVLPTAGGAEAFDLIARGLKFAKPLVIHPQFTEPERALRAAGYQVYRQILQPPNFQLIQIADIYDLVMIGNPTNPTSVLHPLEAIRQLTRPGRLVVVDEAFMDTVPGETESAIGLPGVLVVRSLTKSWSIAGVRAGYVIGEPQVIEQLAKIRPPWAVSTPACTVMCQTAKPLTRQHLGEIAKQRDYLVKALQGLGIHVTPDPAGPFVLAKTADPDIVEKLQKMKISVRDGASFPGLEPGWIRLSVHAPKQTDRLVQALKDIGEK